MWHTQVKPLRANLITALAFIYYWTDDGRVGGARGLVEVGPWEAEGEQKLLQLCSFSREMLNLCVTLPSWIIEGRAVCSGVNPSPRMHLRVPNKIPCTVTNTHTHKDTRCSLASTVLWLLCCWKLWLLLTVWGAANFFFLGCLSICIHIA